MPPQIEPLPPRFGRMTRRVGRCLEWTGPKDRDGYGVVNVGQRKYKAHRVRWELQVGPIPTGLNVLHRCDNPPCVRVVHLFLGTQTDNRVDCVAKGRSRGGRVHLYGERNGGSKLTDEQRIELARLRGAVTQDELGRRYGISQSSVGRIQRGIGRQLLTTPVSDDTEGAG